MTDTEDEADQMQPGTVSHAEEQAALGRVWTFVGLATDLKHDGDWFTAVLGGRTIFVQRFGDSIRAFENRCAHRSYPLRTAHKGNGPVICEFHHWRYNADGLATVIPDCVAQYGMEPRALGRSLARLDVETCGDLVFARWPSPNSVETLEDFLGPIAPVLRGLASDFSSATSRTFDVASNWRSLMRISIDDYHIVAVHPSTFGKSGYLSGARLNYGRHGAHSWFLPDDPSATIETMTAGLALGTYRHQGYRIFHLFPNTALFMIPAFRIGRLVFHYLVLKTLVPIDKARCQLVVRTRLSPLVDLDATWARRLLKPFEPLRAKRVMRGIASVLDEDRLVCERLQRNEHAFDPSPPYAAAERRIGWFDEAYEQALGAGRTPT